MSPVGEDWYISENKQGVILLGKKIRSSTHTFILGIAVVHLQPDWQDAPGFLAAVKREKDLDTNPKRFRLLVDEYELQPSVGKYCVAYHMKAEDYGAPRTNGAPFLLMDTTGLGCMHPNEPDLYIDVFSSERSKPAEASPELQAVGDSFVKSFRFE